ncbi:hypothetical protein [Microbacterium algeriense]|jgi:hypothetical protein|uniref:hypothetical protein n=1 Tax=Microbacterium algeriense TaxID=2615184 RepID=UPI003D737751
MSSGWRRKIQPRALLTLWNRGTNFLIPFNEHHRDFTWPLDDWMHNVRVPADEHVTVAGLWLVELFPPTELPALERAIARNGWDKRRPFTLEEEGNREALTRARSGGGSTWWRVASLVRKGSSWFVPDGIHTDLPPMFEAVELKAIQVGDGLTAVVSEFHLSAAAASSLDKEWHAPHEPFMRFPRGTRPQNYDRHWGAFWKVQTARSSLHGEARSWLASRVPGYFGRRHVPQPLLDLLLLDKLDPTRAEPANISRDTSVHRSNALRALALDSHSPYLLISDALPKMLLATTSPALHKAMGEVPTWTLWGKRDAIVKAMGKDPLAGYGGEADRAIADRLVGRMQNLFVMLAASELLTIAAREQAEVRDRAASIHGKFRPKALRELRRSFLTLSLDLASMQRDVKRFWQRPWYWEGDAKFFYTLTAREQRADREVGRKAKDPIEFNSSVRERQEELFSSLIDSDRDLRDILSTVASLGASADSFKLGRSALVVAIVSLIVAVGTILMADISDTSILGSLLDAVRALW